MTSSVSRATTHERIFTPGKSTFLFFVLARLFSTHQVALLCNTTWAYLFYRGKVYRRPATNGFWDLPENPERLYSPIFALIDVGCGDQGPNLGRDANVWPIQVSSPNPAQWKHWIGQNRAAALGMPLWSTEELMQGYVFSLFPLTPNHFDGGLLLTISTFASGHDFSTGTVIFGAHCRSTSSAITWHPPPRKSPLRWRFSRPRV